MPDIAQLYARPAMLPHITRDKHVHIEEEILALSIACARFSGTGRLGLQYRIHSGPSEDACTAEDAVQDYRHRSITSYRVGHARRHSASLHETHPVVPLAGCMAHETTRRAAAN
jgi:hypothetical protein